MSIFLGAIKIKKEQEGYTSKRELNRDFKRIIQAPKTINVYETMPNSLYGKSVKIKLPNEDRIFKTKVTAEYANVIKGSGKYAKIYDKEFIVEVID